jgi:hypothetical protein
LAVGFDPAVYAVVFEEAWGAEGGHKSGGLDIAEAVDVFL